MHHSTGDLAERRELDVDPPLGSVQVPERKHCSIASRFGRLPRAVAASVVAAALLFTSSPSPMQGAPVDQIDFAQAARTDLPQCDPKPPEPTHDPLGREARRRANEALAEVKSLPANSEIVRERDETRRLLALLGFELSGRARVHVEDVNGEHGGEVLRAAVATSSLAAGAEATLNTTLPNDYFLAHVSRDDAARIRRSWDEFGRLGRGQVTSGRLGALAAIWFEKSIYQVSARVKRVQDDLQKPWDGRRTFVNMSFVVNPYYVTKELAERMVRAPEGSPAHREVARLLGRAPRVDRSCTPGRPNEDDVRIVMERLVQPLVSAALADPEVIARMNAARSHLEQTLRDARRVGIIVFKSSGNDHARAIDLTRNGAYAVDTAAGSLLLIEVCAVDLMGPGRADDRMARFSSAGDVCAAGVDIPVGRGQVGGSKNGTSYASPIEIESAWAIDALVPTLTDAELVDVLLHAQANTRVNGSDMAGVGRTDLFAAVLLARNPSLDRATIDEVRASLLLDPSPGNAAKMRARVLTAEF